MERQFEQDFDAALAFRLTLSPETDRGCALMAAAYLDSRLGEWLALYFVDDPKVANKLLSQEGPLSTFSSRIELAYLLGLLSPRESQALNLIRKIRNEFAHIPEPTSFGHQKIASWCKSLEALGFYKRGNHRAMFTGAVMMVLAAINFRRRHTVHCKARHKR
jgi:DNA-binding MltR family transcriptional regulator